MTMKHFLFLAAAAACFLTVLIVRICEAKLARVPYDETNTQLLTVQEEIVNLHNSLRREVYPPSSNMLKMSWSEEAAQNARTLSMFCDLIKNNAVSRRITNTFCGENKYLTSSPISWSDVIGIWYNESLSFQYGGEKSYNKTMAPGYTQLVWAASYLIGCGVSSCCKRVASQYHYVCHYCHEGNEPGAEDLPYKLGVPCDDCPNNCEDKLCTNPCPYYDEYTNCQEQKERRGCNHPSLKIGCKASCLCNT